LAPTEPLQPVSFKAPAGHTSVALLRVVLPVEHWAWAISGLSAVLLLAWAAARQGEVLGAHDAAPLTLILALFV
jgi:hypothetical protein